MLKTTNIEFKYPSVTFHFPDIHCAAGEALLITGSSGTGKTTLLHLLAGLLNPLSGEIKIGDTDITKLSARQLDRFRGNKIGIIFQQSHFVASISVIENLLLAPYLSGKKVNKGKAKELLNHLNVAEQSDKQPAKLSQGQQQRVSIARALMNNPVMLLADEPTSSLDDENCVRVAELLHAQAKEANAALVIVTHDHRLKQFFKKTVQLS